MVSGNKDMENLDIFDKDFNHIGIASIDDVHTKGLWHQTFTCWVFNPETKVIFLQLRGANNRVEPNTFDASAAGHLSAGESKEDGFRELEEEIGISAKPEDAIYIGTHDNSVHFGNYHNNDLTHTYLLKTDKTLADLELQESEVDGVFELALDDIDDLLDGKEITVKSLTDSRTITLSDMCIAKERTERGTYKLVFDKIKELCNQ